jgi:hypothetical protein
LQAISVSFDDNVRYKEFADFLGSMINFEATSSLIKVETKGKNPGHYIVSLECPDYEAAIESFSRHFREFIFNSNKFAGEVSSRKNPRGDDINLYHFVPVPNIEYIRSNIRQSELTEKLRGCLFIRRDGQNVTLEAKTYVSQDVWNVGGVLISLQYYHLYEVPECKVRNTGHLFPLFFYGVFNIIYAISKLYGNLTY